MANTAQPKASGPPRLYVTAPDEHTADSRVQNYTNGTDCAAWNIVFLCAKVTGPMKFANASQMTTAAHGAHGRMPSRRAYEQQGDDEIMFHIGEKLTTRATIISCLLPCAGCFWRSYQGV